MGMSMAAGAQRTHQAKKSVLFYSRAVLVLVLADGGTAAVLSRKFPTRT